MTRAGSSCTKRRYNFRIHLPKAGLKKKGLRAQQTRHCIPSSRRSNATTHGFGARKVQGGRENASHPLRALMASLAETHDGSLADKTMGQARTPKGIGDDGRLPGS